MSTKLSSLKNRCQGFTLVEVLIALVLLTVAMLGVGAAVGVQSGGTAKSISFGLGAVSRAGSVSTATFLAQDRLERVKGFLVQNYTVNNGTGAVADPFSGAVGAPPGFADEGFGTIPVGPGPGCPCYPNFSRQVRVVAGPVAATNQVTVTVTFTASGDDRVNTENVAVSTLVAARPS